MARSHTQIVADLRAFNPPEQAGWVTTWDELDALVAELWQAGRPADAIPVLLGVFERFPTADGHALWGVMHGLESLSGYQPHLARSVVRQPSVFGVRMLGRMLNGSINDIEGEPIYTMLQVVADNPTVPTEIRVEASGFMDRHPNLCQVEKTTKRKK